MKEFLVYPVLVFLLLNAFAYADFAMGLETYDSRDYTIALKEMKSLAE